MGHEMTTGRPASSSPSAHTVGLGGFWFAGWLFTIGFAKLVWWKIVLGLAAWPYYLATAIR